MNRDYDDDYDDDNNDDDDEEEEEEEEAEEVAGAVRETAGWGASDLVVRALRALDTCEPALAAKFFDKALQMEPNNVAVMDEYAELLLSQGDVAKASRLLQQSMKLAPHGGYSKYMNMGQILEGAEAEQCYQMGVQLMKRDLASLSDEAQRKGLTRELSAGLVSIAELWMTDLCFDPNAEQNCQEAARQAVDADPTHPEAWQTLASLCISQQQPERALEALQRGYDLWKPTDDDEEEEGGKVRMDTGDDGDDEDDDGSERPSFASRLSAAKMFMELEQGETACDILNDLVLENEDDPELYFLLALATSDARERVEMLGKASEKMEKAEREGQTDLEHLKRALHHAIANTKPK